MADRPSRRAGPARGVLHVPTPDGRTVHHRRLPGPALEPFVAHYWTVTWDLASPFKAETLPHPSVHIVFEGQAGRQRTEVAGVHTARFTKQLVGRGQAFGIKFRPGMFKPLWGKSLATLANIPARAIFGARAALWTRQTFAAETFDDQIALSEAFLAPRLSTIPALALRVRDLAERMAVDRALLRVEDACTAVGLDKRALQRCFRTYVGVSPKWVMQRARLHEAAEQLKRAPRSLAALATALGYADQAHFARDFKRLSGCSPAAFARTRAATTEAL